MATKKKPADSENVPYVGLASFGTVGAVTGHNRSIRKDAVVVAPEGEFSHISEALIRRATAAELKATQVETAEAKPVVETRSKAKA